MQRKAEIATGVLVLLVGTAFVLLPMVLLEKLPGLPLLITGGVSIFAGLWFISPVGTGRLGAFLARAIPFLDKDDE